MRLKLWGFMLAFVGLGGAWMALKATDRRHPDFGDDKRKELKAPPASGQRPIILKMDQHSTGARAPLASAPLQANILAADDLNQEWDDLRGVERIEYLESRFGAALAAIEAGEQPITKHAFVAESALSLMRAELYGTAPGRVRHRAYEARLDLTLGEIPLGTQGARK